MIDASSRVLIDTSNLRSGGALQVASALLVELWSMNESPTALRQWPFLRNTEYAVSEEVLANLPTGHELPVGTTIGRRRWLDLARRERKRYDVSFVVFGPEYARGRAKRRLVGCADGLVLFPRPVGLPPEGCRAVLKRRAKRALWRRQTARADLVVESEHLRSRLVELGSCAEHVHVVPNCPHPVFNRRADPRPGIERRPGELLLCYVARGYPHKNHAFLLDLAAELAARHGRMVRFLVTLTPAETTRLPDGWQQHLVNVGPVTVDELPALYTACDGAIFPSLMETSSVTPLEALALGVPLFAADRTFVREVVGDCAGLFDPLDPPAAADAFVVWWDDVVDRNRMVREGRAITRSRPNSRMRATLYLDLIAGMT